MAAGLIVFLVLAWLSWKDLPRMFVSPWISAHFPWPAHGSGRAAAWAALVADRLLIESVFCVPAAALLARLWPRRALAAVLALAGEEELVQILWLLTETDPRRVAYLWLVVALHALVLVGSAAVLRRAWRPQRI